MVKSVYYDTLLPEEVVSFMEKDLKVFDDNLEDSRVGGGGQGGVLEENVRNAKNTWIPDNHWSAGFIWHYVMKANRENFLYDITNIQGSTMQYTVYGEGQFYNLHQDLGISGFYKPNVLPGQCGPEEKHKTLSPEKQRRFVSCHSLFNSLMVMSMRVDSSNF